MSLLWILRKFQKHLRKAASVTTVSVAFNNIKQTPVVISEGEISQSRVFSAMDNKN